ncbi:polyketide synthase [Mycobacterium tuberculosis CAS/NITR204]|uniref:Polyketide synthase n=1 Tax=Mycobacterium tuberculosis CAS/NITR204 TaxID=1310114 RepID=R4MC17_MYCTX|nr:polyketide synthase [Mycobacterium tuberculosis CAS/NITR204]
MPSGMTRWSPDSGETIAERLGLIVGSAMGYEPEDLPWEVPLIELGLDSLMAVRIKNRVEYDFDLPPIQLTAVRDANLYNVEKLIEYAVEHRDEVQQLHEHQKTQTAEEIARAQAELLHGKVGKTEPVDSEAGVALPSPQNGEQPNPTGPALNVDVPPRDAAERVTFATWAIVTGKSPGGIFNELPRLDDEAAAKIAQRLSERAEGDDTAEDVLRRRTSRRWPTRCARIWRPGRSMGSSAPCGRGPKQAGRCRCSCFIRPAARRWCTSRCWAGCRRTPQCMASNGSRGRSKSVHSSTCRS